MKYQNEWDTFMQKKCKENEVNTSGIPKFKTSADAGGAGTQEEAAGSTRKKKKERGKAKAQEP